MWFYAKKQKAFKLFKWERGRGRKREERRKGREIINDDTQESITSVLSLGIGVLLHTYMYTWNFSEVRKNIITTKSPFNPEKMFLFFVLKVQMDEWFGNDNSFHNMFCFLYFVSCYYVFCFFLYFHTEKKMIKINMFIRHCFQLFLISGYCICSR